ncbi:hypothetical protein D3C76_1059670 [compost metagenome]
MFEYADLHRHDIELLAGFFADDMLAATAGAGQFVFGQLMDNFDTWQISRQWLALATALDRDNDFFIGIINYSQQRVIFRFIEHGQLRRFGIDGLLGLAAKKTVTP